MQTVKSLFEKTESEKESTEIETPEEAFPQKQKKFPLSSIFIIIGLVIIVGSSSTAREKIFSFFSKLNIMSIKMNEETIGTFVIVIIGLLFIWAIFSGMKSRRIHREKYDNNIIKLAQLNVLEKRTVEEEIEKLKLEEWFRENANDNLANDLLIKQQLLNNMRKNKY